ncbi:MAG: hypothetical protein HGA83_01270 [Bacteroidales bacterium]|nr:hypothetical protein [Bacteroidales bacterium]NTV18041.1 hypothetical protein [Bacteroidales bacterium]
MKVITTVGTSIFENYQKETSKNLPYYETLEESSYGDWKKLECYIDELRDYDNDNDNEFLRWIDNNFKKSSAEISSLLAIQNEIDDSLEVYLIATETILSHIAAEIIQTKLNGYSDGGGKTINVFFESEEKAPYCDVIHGLDVKNGDDFLEKGLPNLIERLKELGINKEKIILNITGGYKGVIPYLTVLGQICDDIDVMYLYEKTQNVILIPKIPINFNWVVQEKFFSLCMIKNIENSEGSTQISNNEEIDADLSLLFERYPNRLSLSALGKILINTLSVDEIESRHVLGFLMEYRFVKHFNNYVYQDSSGDKYPVVKTPNRNSIYNSCELDLILRQNDISCEKFIAIEIKSFLSKKKLERQVLDQINGFKEKSLCPLEYHIVVYSFIKINKNDLIRWFNDKIVPIIATVENCKPRLGYLYVDWNTHDIDEKGKTQNPYKGYISANKELNIEYFI